MLFDRRLKQEPTSSFTASVITVQDKQHSLKRYMESTEKELHCVLHCVLCVCIMSYLCNKKLGGVRLRIRFL